MYSFTLTFFFYNSHVLFCVKKLPMGMQLFKMAVFLTDGFWVKKWDVLMRVFFFFWIKKYLPSVQISNENLDEE